MTKIKHSTKSNTFTLPTKRDFYRDMHGGMHNSYKAALDVNYRTYVKRGLDDIPHGGIAPNGGTASFVTWLITHREALAALLSPPFVREETLAHIDAEADDCPSTPIVGLPSEDAP